jgi:methylenetetrahydrofolate reductase (NADPH)
VTKISELLAARRTFSFEFMPPKDDEMLRQFEKTVRELEPFAPDFCSVTYGAGGSTRDRTLEAVMHVHHGTDLVAMPHLTCVGQSRAEIDALVSRYRDEGIENVLALAGDPPLDPDAPRGDFRFATDLVELARGITDFSVGVAAFPEVHPNSPDRAEDRRRLAEKLSKADFGITQFFWSVEHYLRMREELDALGVTTPVIPSLFPIGSAVVAERITRTNGAEWPSWLADRLDGAAPADVRRIGIEVATEIGAELLRHDPPGLHLYTLNRSEAVTAIWRDLGLTERRQENPGR